MSTSSILNEFSSNETYYDAHYFNHLANSMLEANRLTFNFEQTSSTFKDVYISEAALINGYYKRFFKEVKKLGSGLRGSVYLVEHVIGGEALGRFAVKIVPVGNNQTWLLKTLTEVHALEKLHHPNIVDYKHAWLENYRVVDFGPSVPCLFVLIEYANSGNLAQYLSIPPNINDIHNERLSGRQSKIEKIREHLKIRSQQQLQGTQFSTSGAEFTNPTGNFRIFSELEILYIMKDFLSGLQHLHMHNIVHRDLKPQNLLLHDDEDPNKVFPHILVSDFGECEMMSTIGLRARTGNTGTIEYMSPELLQVDDDGHYYKAYDQKSDMWSVGVILYLLMYQKLPWTSCEPSSVRQEILSFDVKLVEPPSPSHVSESLLHLLKALLQRDPHKRPSVHEALKFILKHYKVQQNGPLGASFNENSELIKKNNKKRWGVSEPLKEACVVKAKRREIAETLRSRSALKLSVYEPTIQGSYWLFTAMFLLFLLSKDKKSQLFLRDSNPSTDTLFWNCDFFLISLG